MAPLARLLLSDEPVGGPSRDRTSPQDRDVAADPRRASETRGPIMAHYMQPLSLFVFRPVVRWQGGSLRAPRSARARTPVRRQGPRRPTTSNARAGRRAGPPTRPALPGPPRLRLTWSRRHAGDKEMCVGSASRRGGGQGSARISGEVPVMIQLRVVGLRTLAR